ncbi:hypothetical protein GDO86_017149 [Hymenochirus boettgeri]|uniref:HMG box domain-containing protein n=1 Tax=Hymenochirus boettgeri TaxID=247094 RepID=A0A8T2IIN5_9PIPI|nr:hypothetical protein GDO86_017149 [Hymenochirus boettgeri]
MIRVYYNHNLNKESYPIFFMNIVLPPSRLDVNLTPDKTHIILQNKESVLLAIENVLKSLYPGTIISDNATINIIPEAALIDIKHSNTEFSSSCSTLNKSLTEKQSDITKRHQKPSTVNLLNTDISEGNSGFLESTLNSSAKNKNKNGFGLTFSVGHSVLMDTQTDNSSGSLYVKHLAEEETKNNSSLVDVIDTGEDTWSKGSAFKNSVGENIKPVQIINEKMKTDIFKECDIDNIVQHPANANKKPSNVICEKTGFITAYDLISNRAIKKPLSAIDHFIHEQQNELSEGIPKTSIEDASKKKKLWETMSHTEKLKYEEKAAKDLKRFTTQTAKAAEQQNQIAKETEKKLKMVSGSTPSAKVKLKAPLSNQQILDKLFLSQTEKKKNTSPIKSITVEFNLSFIRQQLSRLSKKLPKPEKEEFCLISKLNFPGAWVAASEAKITLVNPYRAEEALLFKSLLKNHKIPAEKLESPIVLTDRLLGGTDYVEALLRMQKDSPKLNGETYFSDPRLNANGFIIKMLSGISSVENYFEIEGIASCLPFYGISDLKEILLFELNKNSNELCDCRPLKVLNYLEGEAVRLSRQLPLNLSREDVWNTLHRVNELGGESKECLHNRPFFHHLIDIPNY